MLRCHPCSGGGAGELVTEHCCFETGAEQLGLGVEGEVEGLHGNVCPCRDVGHRRACVPALDEQLLGGSDHSLARTPCSFPPGRRRLWAAGRLTSATTPNHTRVYH